MHPAAPRLALLATLLLPVLACDATSSLPPVESAASSEPPSSPESAALGAELRDEEAKLAALRAQVRAEQARTAPASAPPRAATPMPAFVAGGEQRIECPIGYHAQATDGVGCECASSTGSDTVPVTKREAACSTNARAEADECILTCPSGDAP